MAWVGDGGICTGAVEQDGGGAAARGVAGPGMVAARAGGAAGFVAQPAVLWSGNSVEPGHHLVPIPSGHRPLNGPGGQFLVTTGGRGLGGVVLSLQGGMAAEFDICLSAVAD